MCLVQQWPLSSAKLGMLKTEEEMKNLQMLLKQLRYQLSFGTRQGVQVPEVATKNVHLEAALATQRLAMQETVDLDIHVYEEIIYIGHYKASEDRKTLAFF